MYVYIYLFIYSSSQEFDTVGKLRQLIKKGTRYVFHNLVSHFVISLYPSITPSLASSLPPSLTPSLPPSLHYESLNVLIDVPV